MSEVREVIAAMRERAESMKGGPAKGALLAWVEKLEAAKPEQPPDLRTGVFDNRAAQRREMWVNGKCGPTQPAERCPPAKPFGTYPDVEDK